MSLSRLKLVSVDVTNTLIKVNTSPGHQYSKIARNFGIEVDENLLSNVWLKKYKEYTVKYPNFGATIKMPSSVWWCELVKDCFRSVDSNLNEPALEKVAQSLDHYFTTAAPWEFLPGSFNALKDLRRYHVKTAVISNFDERLYKVLDALQLTDYFDFILPSYTLGIEKPDPAIFQLALQKAECSPEEAVHFGDNVEKDFFGARGVGMDSYLLAGRKSSSIDENFVVPDVQSFVDTIRPRLGNPS